MLNIHKIMKCRGEAAAIGVVETNGLVSPPPRPSLDVTEEGSGNRERRPLVSQPRSTRLPDPYATLDIFQSAKAHFRASGWFFNPPLEVAVYMLTTFRFLRLATDAGTE